MSKDGGIVYANIVRFPMHWLICFTCSLLISTAYPEDLRYIPYLCKKGRIEHAVKEYLEKTNGNHQPNILTDMAIHIIESGIHAPSLEAQLNTLYGINIAHISDRLSYLKNSITSYHPNVQLATIYLLGELHEDEVEEILSQAMSSRYLPVRLEALFRLCQRKSKLAFPYIESLKNLIPEQYMYFLPELYTLIGSKESTIACKKLFSSRYLETRVSAILNAAKYQRDDFLPLIRMAGSHINPAEQEAVASALGYLNDLTSKELLIKLTNSSFEDIPLAAYLSLMRLGFNQYANEVKKIALNGNPFAIYALKDFPDSSTILVELQKNSNDLISLNATIALLHQKNPKCLPNLIKILENSSNFFAPIFSSGRSLMAWKKIDQVTAKKKYPGINFGAISKQFKEQHLIFSLELKERHFLQIAHSLMQTQQYPLIPTLVRLLENINSNPSIDILKTSAQKPGDPFIRNYALLGLYRLQVDENYTKSFLSNMKQNFHQQLIRFQPLEERAFDQYQQKFELTPDEQSQFLLEAYEAVANNKTPESINLLLEAIQKGIEENRSILAGLLLNTIL